MKPITTLFKHYCIEVVGPKGSTTMRFRTENEALAFKKAIIYAQVYSTIKGVYTNEIFIDYLSIEMYDIEKK